MTVYKLYGTGVTDNIASLDIVNDGVINAVKWACRADLDADLETMQAEISFASASGFATNDTRSSISGVQAAAAASGTPASLTVLFVNQFDGPDLGIPVAAGERLYLHGGGTSFTGTAWIYVDDKSSNAGRRVRL